MKYVKKSVKELEELLETELTLAVLDADVFGYNSWDEYVENYVKTAIEGYEEIG